MFLTIFLGCCIFTGNSSCIQDEFNVDYDGYQQKQHGTGL